MKFGRNLIKYMSVQQFWNLSQLLGVFSCRKLTSLCQSFVTEMWKQSSETTRRRLCCETLGTSHDVKGFATGSFLEHIVVERAMMTSVRKTSKTMVWSAQNQSMSSEIYPENNHKIRHFFTDCFPAKFAPKIPMKFPRNRSIFPYFVAKNPAKFYFFSATYQKPCLTEVSLSALAKSIYYAYNVVHFVLACTVIHTRSDGKKC